MRAVAAAAVALFAPAASAQFFVEAGVARVRDHGDGIWYQEAFAPRVDLASPTFAVGYRLGAWSVGAAYLFSVSSHSKAVHDHEYDPHAHRCLANCDLAATFDSEGYTFGAFLRHEWKLAHGITLELGGLLFSPRQSVSVSGWRENRDAPVSPAVTYTNDVEWKITPSIGAGWQSQGWRVMGRFYPWVKTSGDEVAGGTFTGLTGLYNGPTGTLTVSYDF